MDKADVIERVYFYFVENQKRSNSANFTAEQDDVYRKLSDFRFASLSAEVTRQCVRIVEKFPSNFWVLNLRVIIF